MVPPVGTYLNQLFTGFVIADATIGLLEIAGNGKFTGGFLQLTSSGTPDLSRKRLIMNIVEGLRSG